MFGRQQTSQGSAKEFDLDELLNSTLKDVDDDLDMNDPDLLKQLQELSSSTPKPKPKTPQRKPQIQNMEIDIDSYTALAQGDDDDIHVDLEEKDFSDPHLLNELSSLSNDVQDQPKPNQNISELVNMGFTQDQAVKALDMFDNNLERAANYLFDIPQDMDTNTSTHQEEEESTDPYYWQEKAQEYKKLALAAKKEGNKSNAVALLRESKVFSQKYQDLLEIQPIKESEPIRDLTPPPRDPTPPPRDPTPPPLRDPTPPPPSTQPSLPPRELTPPHPTTQDLKQLQELLGKVISLQKQYKEAALHYKGLGNLTAAKQMVRTSKDLLHTGIKLKNGEITNIQQVKLPNVPDMSLGDGKIRQLAEASSGISINSYEQIESELTYQMNVCHNLSIQNDQINSKKSSKILSDSKDNYSKVETAFSTDLVSLRSYKSMNQNIPSLHYEPVNYTYKNILDNIPDNMMEFKIIRAISLPTLDISVHLDPFVTWDFGGWPPENTAQATMNKGETPVVTGINPQYDFSIMIPISRTNRLFTRYVQRKKLTVEVFHNKYTYGLFRRPVSLGKIILPMDRLLTKSSISGVFDLLDSSRKKTGGKIEIQVNLREPLNGEDIVKRSERWLVLDSFGSTASQCMAFAGLTVGGPYTNPNTPQLENLSVTNSPVVKSPIPQTETPERTPKPLESVPVKLIESISPNSSNINMIDSEEGGELKLAEEEFNSVDNIISNMVMEHELSLVNAGLASKQPTKSKEDLMDRKQALEIKMNMLVIQVQTGMLDMNTYLENVQKRLENDRRLAIIFKKHNRLDLAKAALVRKKIMQDELDEARAAMAAQEE